MIRNGTYFFKILHNYILTTLLNWSLQPFNQNYDITSHNSYVVCFNLTFRFFETFHGREEVAEEIFFLYSVLLDQGLTSNKPTHYLVAHGEFATLSINIHRGRYFLGNDSRICLARKGLISGTETEIELFRRRADV